MLGETKPVSTQILAPAKHFILRVSNEELHREIKQVSMQTLARAKDFILRVSNKELHREIQPVFV
jgi:very-short-patch-repair endonuclease